MQTLSPQQFADQLGVVSRRTVLNWCHEGRVQAVRDNAGAWSIPVTELERMRANAYREAELVQEQLRAKQSAGSDAAPDPEVPASYDDVRATVARFHILSVEREVILRSLVADAREAAQRGDPVRERTCAELAEMLRDATYAWDAQVGRWRIEAGGEVGYSGYRGAVVPGAEQIS